MSWWKKILIGCIALCVIFLLILFLLSRKDKPQEIIYGMSFNTMYARELGLDWQETYDAILDELGARHLRLAAHWPMTEPINDVYNFKELDYQLQRAEEVGADVILGVGRRLPRWPECHVPDWAQDLTWDEQKGEILEYMRVVMERYKDRKVITHWQIENEPFLEVFANQHCGDLDEEFFARQIDHARSLDGTRPLLVTDSGNLGTWHNAYQYGDVFGTSMYIHFWNPELGQFRTVLPPQFYRIKENIMELLYGKKDTLLIELSAEPWLVEPITQVPIDVQYSRMDVGMFEDILQYARDSRFERQYLWGAEWWYWLDQKGHPEMWDRGLELFSQASNDNTP